MKDKTLAMLADWGNGMTGPLEDMYNKGEQLNWDMAALPNFKENLGKSREVDLHLLFISKTSQHKDQAFQVISLINSNEVQTIINKSGRLSSLKKNAEFKASYGSDLGSMKGKHLEAIFKTVPSPIHAQTEYDKIVKAKLKDAAAFVAKRAKDVNTALRDAQEESDQAIAAELAN
jgi:multiple sugar transport system substrate-binding protein